MPVPKGGLDFSADGRKATLKIKNLPIVDQPNWPSMKAETHAAFLDFRLVWTAGNQPVKYENPSEQYRFTGFQATAQLEARVRVPALKFSWKSDPLETSRADFAVIGEEVNGKYYATG